MAFGIIEPASNPQPQGTSLLESLSGESNSNAGHVVLVPEPSASPDDPLNFSRVRKELMFGTLVLGACSMGVIGPILVPGFNIVAADFGFTSLTKVTLLNGSLIIGLGVSSYLCACLSVVYGKRLVYVATTLLTMVSCIWAAASKNYESLLVSRLFQGEHHRHWHMSCSYRFQVLEWGHSCPSLELHPSTISSLCIREVSELVSGTSQ